MNAGPPVIASREGFVAALRWGFETAFAQGARRIVCVDADFAPWSLDDPAVLEGLTAWLRLPQRRLVLLARSYDEVPRRWPRFTAWRSDWAHAVEAWQPPLELASDLPTLLVSDQAVCVHLIDTLQWRGQASSDSRLARLWCEQVDVLLQRSEPAFGVSTLGL
ncbi:MAG: hypothetical protein Q8K45_07505 [Rubrivivax sp.]|nr:hypothetical protein [Rubrivivax sp.]